MKKLIWKELREQLPLAVIGLCIFSLLLAMNFSSCRSVARATAISSGYGDADQFLPLLATATLMSAGFFCGIFGALLGFRQIHAERHPDLRAFLMHRPIAPGAILRSKAYSGLLLYSLGAGLPLVVLIVVASRPGQVAAPFEWPMALPLVGLFLTGAIFYGGGLLTGLRQARWYASRGCGLGAPILVAFATVVLPEFWHALTLIASVGLAIGLAVWGSFRTGGTDHGQPATGRIGLAITTALSAAMLIGAIGAFLANFLLSSRDFRYAQYQMMRNGTVVRIFNHGATRETEVTDPAGQPVLDPATGQKLDFKGAQKGFAPAIHTAVPTSDDLEKRVLWGYARPARYFMPARVQDKILWYLTSTGRLLGYDGITRREVGEITPPAAAPNAVAGSSGFQPLSAGFRNYFQPSEVPAVLAAGRSAYIVDLAGRSLQPLFTADDGDRILGLSVSQGYPPPSPTSNQVVVATRNFIQLLEFDGRVRFKVPYDPPPAQYPTLSTFVLTSSVPYVVRLDPSYRQKAQARGGLPIQVKRIRADGTVDETLDLPELPAPQSDSSAEKFFIALLPPGFFVVLGTAIPSETTALRIGAASLFALIGLGLAWRRGFSWAGILGWTVFHLVFGLAGLLAFFAIQEWPARVPCPSCRRQRAVNRELCEYCEAPFAPPARTGIEIFEPLRAQGPVR